MLDWLSLILKWNYLNVFLVCNLVDNKFDWSKPFRNVYCANVCRVETIWLIIEMIYHLLNHILPSNLLLFDNFELDVSELKRNEKSRLFFVLTSVTQKGRFYCNYILITSFILQYQLFCWLYVIELSIFLVYCARTDLMYWLLYEMDEQNERV